MGTVKKTASVLVLCRSIIDMARIIDAIGINKKRFAAFAEEYLEIPPAFYRNGLIQGEDGIIKYLIDKGVFDVEELKVEFKVRKIYISEKRLLKLGKGE